MKALSVRQPWAELIALGMKVVELRSWPTEHRGPLLIVAGLKRDDTESALLWSDVEGAHGVAVCVVDVLACRPARVHDMRLAGVRPREFPLAKPLFSWVLDNPQRVKPFAVRGALGLFEAKTPRVW